MVGVVVGACDVVTFRRFLVEAFCFAGVAGRLFVLFFSIGVKLSSESLGVRDVGGRGKSRNFSSYLFARAGFRSCSLSIISL